MAACHSSHLLYPTPGQNTAVLLSVRSYSSYYQRLIISRSHRRRSPVSPVISIRTTVIHPPPTALFSRQTLTESFRFRLTQRNQAIMDGASDSIRAYFLSGALEVQNGQIDSPSVSATQRVCTVTDTKSGPGTEAWLIVYVCQRNCFMPL